ARKGLPGPCARPPGPTAAAALHPALFLPRSLPANTRAVSGPLPADRRPALPHTPGSPAGGHRGSSVVSTGTVAEAPRLLTRRAPPVIAPGPPREGGSRLPATRSPRACPTTDPR